MENSKKKIEYLVVDTTAFLQNAPLHQYAENIYTCQEVVDEVTNRRQRHRLLVLPYDLKIKTVFPESIQAVMEFSKKTGDYASLSLTDLKVMALTYQLEKEHVGINHLRKEPIHQKTVQYDYINKKPTDIHCNLPGWFCPKSDEESECESDEDSEHERDEESEDEESDDEKKESIGNDVTSLSKNLESLNCQDDNENTEESVLKNKNDKQEDNNDDIEVLREKFGKVDYEANENTSNLVDAVLEKVEDGYEEMDKDGWITPGNCKRARQMMYDTAGDTEDKEVKVACMTTDFAMQNVLKQINLNVAALNGRVIKQVRTFILRCYICFKTTSIMTKVFCPKCGNQSLKKVSVSVDEEGKMIIHINGRKRISMKGKRFNLPKIRGGKHPNNPIIVEDQRLPQNLPTKLARQKNNPLNDDYIAGYSPFVMRDVTSKSAQLGIRSGNRQQMNRRRNGKKR